MVRTTFKITCSKLISVLWSRRHDSLLAELRETNTFDNSTGSCHHQRAQSYRGQTMESVWQLPYSPQRAEKKLVTTSTLKMNQTFPASREARRARTDYLNSTAGSGFNCVLYTTSPACHTFPTYPKSPQSRHTCPTLLSATSKV